MSVAHILNGDQTLQFDNIEDAFRASTDMCSIILDDNTTFSQSILISGIEVTLDLNGYKLEATHTKPGVNIINAGRFTLKDSSQGNQGKLIVKDIGITVGTFNDFDDKNTFTMYSGNLIAQEFGVAVYGSGIVNIYGGLIEGIDNSAVGGNGSSKFADYPYTINIFGGKLIGGTTSSGYANCGLYAPNSGQVNISGGLIEGTLGAGIVVRGGQVNISGGQVVGSGSTQGLKMGDASPTFCGGLEICNSTNYPGKMGLCAVSGGEISSKTNGGIVVIGSPNNSEYFNSKDSKVVVSGGTIGGKQAISYLEKDGSELSNSSQPSNLTVYGGKFTSDISNYLVEDAQLKQVVNQDGTISYQVEKSTIDVINSLDAIHETIENISKKAQSILEESQKEVEISSKIDATTSQTLNELSDIRTSVPAKLDNLLNSLNKVLDVTKKTLIEVGSLNGDDLSSELQEDKTEAAIELMQLQSRVNQAKLYKEKYIIWNHRLTSTIYSYCKSQNYIITRPYDLGGQYMIFIEGQ